jgi:hypothetical protein
MAVCLCVKAYSLLVHVELRTTCFAPIFLLSFDRTCMAVFLLAMQKSDVIVKYLLSIYYILKSQYEDLK